MSIPDAYLAYLENGKTYVCDAMRICARKQLSDPLCRTSDAETHVTDAPWNRELETATESELSGYMDVSRDCDI